MPYNLLEMPWLPLRRRSGSVEWVEPWRITDSIAEDPFMEPGAARPDFNGAIIQFLIGLLQTFAATKDRDAWYDLVEAIPPDPSVLREWMSRAGETFILDGDAPRFMQDLNLREGTICGVGSLLIDEPGENTTTNNKDFFIKRDRFEGLCVDCAALALFTLQTNAPAGGQGGRTSLRGGGPLTTLVMGNNLWFTVIYNLLDTKSFEDIPGDTSLPAISEHTLPWLAPTRTSEKKDGVNTTPMHCHPLQHYWGMPRRIRLDFQDTSVGTCNLCGRSPKTLVRQYLAKNYGVNYEGVWMHPLSPYRMDNEGLPICRHAGKGGIGYRHWHTLVGPTRGDGPQNKTAKVVQNFQDAQVSESGTFNVWAFGYDMDNMKARCWYESRLPAYRIPEEYLETFQPTVKSLVESSDLVGTNLRTAVRNAWFGRPGDAKGDMGFLDLLFSQRTESTFFHLLGLLVEAIRNSSTEKVENICRVWHRELSEVSLKIFEEYALYGKMEDENPKRIAKARNKLISENNTKKLRTMLYL